MARIPEKLDGGSRESEQETSGFGLITGIVLLILALIGAFYWVNAAPAPEETTTAAPPSQPER